MPRSISVSGVAASARSTTARIEAGIGVPSSAGLSSASVESMPRSGGNAAIRCDDDARERVVRGLVEHARLHRAQRGVLRRAGRAALGQHRIDGVLEQPAPLVRSGPWTA